MAYLRAGGRGHTLVGGGGSAPGASSDRLSCFDRTPEQREGPKWQRTDEAQSGSSGLTPKCPHLVVLR